MKLMRFAVLGAGKQGEASAYDLAKDPRVSHVVVADKDVVLAREVVQKLTALAGRNIFIAQELDASNTKAVRTFLRGWDLTGFVSAMHFNFNLTLTELAVEAGCHMVDLGGNTTMVRRQHELHEEAAARGVTIVPDCGMAPGLDVNLAYRALLRLHAPKSVRIYCGGIPGEAAAPPLNYHFPFSVKGLVNECSGFADVLRGGTLAKQECLVGREMVRIASLGELEAAYTSGGLSTAPWTFQRFYPGLETVEYKTLRYPGHWAILEDFAKQGVLERELTRLASEHPPGITPDLGIIQAVAQGTDRDGEPHRVAVEVIDRYDPKTGFTAMQRLTGFHAAVVLQLAAGERYIPRGVVSVESINPVFIIHELGRRGIEINEYHGERK